MPDIDFQKIELNLIPKKGEQPVVFYASQYETARPFIADLFWGETEFAPGVDCYAEIDIRKNDDNLVVITDDVSIDNNEVSVILPVQAVTCIGKNLGQVKIYAADDQLIAALNFILEVQADPLAGGITSETAIDNLTQQIEDIATEVIGEDYYNKTETDALLADKADKSELPDMTDYYTKTQTDNLLNDKADLTDLATLASKAELTQAINDEDTALKNWAYTQFTTPGYVASNYYTKLQVDEFLYNMLPVGSASGNPCSFDTVIAAPLQALTANIVCGGGYDADTQTANPLVGYSALNLDVNGDTFTISFGQTVYGGTYNKSGTLTITHAIVRLDQISWDYSGGNIFMASIADCALVSDATQLANWKCSCFPIIVQSGHQAGVSGISASNWFNGLTFWNETGYTQSTFEAAIAGQTCAYELTTPIEISVDAISPSAVSGNNTITSDCNGDVNVSYKDTIQHYIDERL